MKKHNLTIIIPHYNSSNLLEKLLSTIPKDKNIEIIVIDDKSDTTHIDHILNLQKVYNFIFLRNYTDIKSAGTARNIGLEKANGEWILFADADDYFTEIFYENISKYFDSENDIIFFIPTSIYLDTGKISNRHIGSKDILENYILDPSSENELRLRYKLSSPWSKMIKKEFILKNNIKFDEVIASNDVMFSMKVGFYMKKFEISENILYVVTRNKGSLTTELNEHVFDSRFKVLIFRYNFLENRLIKENFDLLNLSYDIRLYIGKSIKYGVMKVFDTLIIIRKNDINFFHYKLLNPLHVLKKILHYRKQTKKDEKYAINKKP